jgi:hypothetical protein
VPEELVADIAKSVYSGDSPTFFRSSVGKWKKELNDRHLQLIDAEIGDLISLYGYDR